VSQELIDHAGIDLGAHERHDVEIRGRQGRLTVQAIKRAIDLTAMS
jgi:adenylate cyclase